MTHTIHVSVNSKRNVAIDFAVIQSRLAAGLIEIGVPRCNLMVVDDECQSCGMVF